MKIISLFVLIIFPFTLIGQTIDSIIIGKFKIINYSFHKYESNEKWKIQFTNNEGKHFLTRSNTKLLDSCILENIKNDTVYFYELAQFKIGKSRIIKIDTGIVWQEYKGVLRKFSVVIYNKRGVLKTEIHYSGEDINDTIDIYSRIEFKFPGKRKWYRINYFDYQNNLVVKARKNYRNRDFGDGVWRFYKPNGELEAKCYLDLKQAKSLKPIKDTLVLNIIFINSLHYYVKVPNMVLYNSWLISHLAFRDYKYFKIREYKNKMIVVQNK